MTKKEYLNQKPDYTNYLWCVFVCGKLDSKFATKDEAKVRFNEICAAPWNAPYSRTVSVKEIYKYDI